MPFVSRPKPVRSFGLRQDATPTRSGVSIGADTVAAVASLRPVDDWPRKASACLISCMIQMMLAPFFRPERVFCAARLGICCWCSVPGRQGRGTFG